jgi:hypothetical protein
MSIDYDVPYRHKDDENVEGFEELQAVSATRSAQQPQVEQDEAEIADSFELPGADLSGESLTVRVEPRRADEFTCTSCFLVHHHSQLVDADSLVCRDCA